MEDQLMTPKEVSKKLHLCVSTIYRWGWERRIPSVKVFGALRFRSSDIECLIREGFRPALHSKERRGTGGLHQDLARSREG